MRWWSVVERVVIVCIALALPVGVSAQQEAVVSGIVTDTTGSVLPGVTVTAVLTRCVDRADA